MLPIERSSRPSDPKARIPAGGLVAPLVESVRALVLAVILVGLSVVPVADASSRSFYFGPAPNAAPLDSTFQLVNVEPDAGEVDLPANERVLWVEPGALGAPAAVQNGAMSFDLYFTEFGGELTIEYGHATPAGVFTAIGSGAFDVEPTPRNLVNGVLPPGLPADIGHVEGQVTGITGSLPQGNHIAIRLTSDADNTLHTAVSSLGASSASTATVPLPELPALVLTAMGLALVAGVVMIRRRAA